MPRGGKRPGAGRPKGIPNKVTRDVREAIAVFAAANVDRMSAWLADIESKDPAKAFDLYLRAIEYHVPKLGRSEVTGADGGPVEYVIRDLAKEPEDG